ncbi:hypothetical protein AB6A40_000267 [Gnathostoma spinigerum]|uniref:FYVE-type domain-containing protein n=1 Tax=Gnathostoma spinigerum TaxID=75299 RepID=A0ABD6EA08_9BILA
METVPDMDDLLDQLEASEIINITNHMKDYSIKLASSECDENKKEEIKLNKGKMENGDSPVSFEMDNNASIELNKDHDNCSELSELCISQSINGPGVKDVDACDAQAVPSSIEINASDSNSETSGLDSNRSSTIDAYASECANINVENSISSVCDNWNDNKSVAEAPDAQEKSSAPETDFLLMKKTKSSSLSLHRRSGESSTVHEESVAMEGCLSNRTLGGRKTESKSTADAQNDGPTGGVIEVDLNQERGIAEEVDLGSAELAGQDTETKRELGLEEPVLGHISANVSNKSTVNDDCPEKRDARVFVDEVVSIGNSEAQSDERSGRATGALVVGSAGDYASEDVETVASHGAPSSATNHMENCTVINDEGIPSDEAGSDVHESPSKVVEAESNLESEAGFENRNVEVSQFDSKLRSDDGQPESGEVDHEGEEVLEDSHLSSDESASPDVTTHPSVVEGVYDISVESDIKRLTESELQLGKVKPVWIADSETTLCMLCCAKFTVLMRRHHCRSCGRVLCAHCTDKKAALPYMNQPTKKFRVCDPCFTTLGLIDEVEKSPSAASKRGEDQSGVDDQVNGNPSAVEVRRKKSVLKQTATSSANQSDLTLAEGQDDALLLENERRSVKFLDGVNPGQDSNPSSPSASSSTPPAVDSSCVLPSLKSKKKSSSKRTHVWRRLKELRIEKECVCLLPDNVETLPYTKLPDGRIDKYHSSEDITKQLKDRNPVVIALSRDLYCTVKICELECCSLGNVWCFCTSGMNGVGLDELLLVYDWQESDDFNLPMDILHRLYDIYDGALQPQDESTDEKMGIRMAENRIPYINYLNHESPNGSFAQRDILLFRPTIQCFDNLIVPESPFLVCCFLHPSESVWARAIPQRLLYRIGLQASCRLVSRYFHFLIILRKQISL